MTKTELIKIIKEVVSKEVKKEINKVFIKEETSSKLSKVVPKQKTKIKKSKKEVNYTTNETLNKVLNETVGLSKKSSEFDEYPTVTGKPFDSSRAKELMGYGKTEEQKRDMAAVDTLQKAGVTSKQVPEHITDALTRDYSGLMKAINKKK
jgi:hypothetical protein